MARLGVLAGGAEKSADFVRLTEEGEDAHAAMISRDADHPRTLSSTARMGALPDVTEQRDRVHLTNPDVLHGSAPETSTRRARGTKISPRIGQRSPAFVAFA